MHCLIVFATTEGQTEKICRYFANRLRAQGNEVVLKPAETAPGADGFDAVVLAGSVHAGRIQGSLADYASAQPEALNARPTLYLQVSLAAAGDDPEEHADLDRIAERFSQKTRWRPGRTEHIAGAFRFTQYDFLKYWAMRWIAHQKGQDIDPHTDTEYTDWKALEALADDWGAEAAKAAAGTRAPAAG